MVFIENNKSIQFSINNYEYPTEKSSQKGDFNYDANWLICEIKYTEDDFTEFYSDACLLTYELEELATSLSKILDGKESGYISSFMEPYLQISMARAEEKILFIIHFVYDTTKEWKKRKITSLVEKEYASQILNKLIDLKNLYPER